MADQAYISVPAGDLKELIDQVKALGRGTHLHGLATKLEEYLPLKMRNKVSFGTREKTVEVNTIVLDGVEYDLETIVWMIRAFEMSLYGSIDYKPAPDGKPDVIRTLVRDGYLDITDNGKAVRTHKFYLMKEEIPPHVFR